MSRSAARHAIIIGGGASRSGHSNEAKPIFAITTEMWALGSRPSPYFQSDVLRQISARSWLETISRRPIDQRKYDYSRISSTEQAEMR